MPVETRHDDYLEFEENNIWRSCRDAMKGSYAVKKEDICRKYLPQGSMDDEPYRAFRDRAPFFGASSRSRDSFLGCIFRKSANLENAPNLDDFILDVTKQNVNLENFSKTITKEILEVGRAGILVEMPNDGSKQAEPYFMDVKGEDIMNWREGWMNGQFQLTEVRLRHFVTKPSDADPYEDVRKEQRVVLKLNEEGNYQQEIWEKDADSVGKFHMKGEAIIPMVRSKPIKYIPFVFINTSTNLPGIENPPLLDLVNENLSHYRVRASYYHGIHFAGFTQWYAAGNIPADEEFRVGGDELWIFPEGTTLGSLQTDGTKLPHAQELSEIEKRMAVLGARLLEGPSGKVEEKPEAMRLRATGEGSVLASIAGSVEHGLTIALKWASEWLGSENPELTYELNKDYVDQKMSFNDLTALVSAWQTGAIDFETLFYNLERGEITKPGEELDDYQHRLSLESVAEPSEVDVEDE